MNLQRLIQYEEGFPKPRSRGDEPALFGSGDAMGGKTPLTRG